MVWAIAKVPGAAKPISLVYSVNCLERLCDQVCRPDRLGNDLAHFIKRWILPVQLKILLAADHLRATYTVALQAS
jgi:hypothetical protein